MWHHVGWAVNDDVASACGALDDDVSFFGPAHSELPCGCGPFFGPAHSELPCGPGGM